MIFPIAVATARKVFLCCLVNSASFLADRERLGVRILGAATELPEDPGFNDTLLRRAGGGVGIPASPVRPALWCPHPEERDSFRPSSSLSDHRAPRAPLLVVNSYGYHF